MAALPEGRDGYWDIGNWEFLAGLEFPDLLWLPLDPWQCPRPGLDNLGQWELSLPWQGWHWVGFEVPSNPTIP